MSNNIFSNSTDKLNSVSTILLYIHRMKISGTIIDTEMVKSILTLVKSKSPVVEDMKLLALEVLNNNELTKTALIDMITLNMPDDLPIVGKLKELINIELTEEDMKIYLDVMTKNIKENSIVLKGVSAVNNTSFVLNTKEMSVEEQAETLAMLKSILADIETNKISRDDDEIESVSIGSTDLLASLNKSTSSKVRFKLGWSELTRALAGGPGRGELVVIEALQHKNKTGFTLAIFLQMIMLNKIIVEEGKKPLFIWISLEDDISQIIMKAYIYTYFFEYKKMPTLSEITNEDIDYVLKELFMKKYGVDIVFKRIDSSKFSIEKYQGIVNTYDALGYEVVCTSVDYLEKAANEANRYNSGATGSGLKNMFTIFRTYNYEQNILFMTPHQIAVDALSILRGGVTDVEFLKLIKGKNFTQGSRGLPQEFDVEILIHLCKVSGIDYQAVQIGKLKRPEYVNPLHKFMLIPFEKNSGSGLMELNGPLMESRSSTHSVVVEDNEDDGELNL